MISLQGQKHLWIVRWYSDCSRKPGQIIPRILTHLEIRQLLSLMLHLLSQFNIFFLNISSSIRMDWNPRFSIITDWAWFWHWLGTLCRNCWLCQDLESRLNYFVLSNHYDIRNLSYNTNRPRGKSFCRSCWLISCKYSLIFLVLFRWILFHIFYGNYIIYKSFKGPLGWKPHRLSL